MTVKSSLMWSAPNTMMELTLGQPSSRSNNASSPPTAQEDHIESKLTAYLRSLEDERHKIEAFKRELPICMHLLTIEIEASKMQLGDCQPDATRTNMLNADTSISTSLPSGKVNFIASNLLNSRREESNHCDSSSGDEVQPQMQASCWQRTESHTFQDNEDALDITSTLYKIRTSSCEEDSLGCRTTLEARPGGAFVPFLKDKKRQLMDDASETISLAHMDHEGTCPAENRSGDTGFVPGVESAPFQNFTDGFPQGLPSATNGFFNQTSPHRKPRRCWSAELHRKFVNALKQLGGPEVATPKQIREIMKVDGLTNDEVKSHLQKYRLHSKRSSPVSGMHIATAAAAGAMAAGPQLVVLGRIWVPQEYHLKQPLCMKTVPATMDPSLLNQNFGMQAQRNCTASAQ